MLILLSTIVANPVATLISAAAFLLAVVAGWVALTNRGAKRQLAIVVGAAATLAALLAVLPDSDHRAFLLVVVGGIALAVFAGRFAIGKPPRALPAGDLAAPADRPALVVNPRSGDGRATELGLSQVARDLGIRVYEFDGSVPVIDLVQQALADGADVVGVAGGDGSLAAAARMIAARGVEFVCIPSGTRNHFALDLGLDRADPLAGLAAFGPAVRRRIDMAQVNGRPFLNNVSLGLYGEIVHDSGYRDAKLGTVLGKLPDLVTQTPEEDLDLRFTDPQGVERSDAQVIHVSNNPYLLTGPAIGSRPRLDSGELGVVCLRVDGGARVAEIIARTALGSTGSDTIQAWSAPSFQVRSERPVAAGIDGEAVTLESPLLFEALPAAVSVRLPASASGESPAAQARGYRWTIRELSRRAFLPTSHWHESPQGDTEPFRSH